jgi:hypothetical protein
MKTKKISKIQREVLEALLLGGYLIEAIQRHDKRRYIFLYLDPGGNTVRNTLVNVRTFDCLFKLEAIEFVYKDETCLADYLRFEITEEGKALLKEVS